MLTADKEREMRAILLAVSQQQQELQQLAWRNELHLPQSQPTEHTSPQRVREAAAPAQPQHCLLEVGGSGGGGGSASGGSDQINAPVAQPVEDAAGVLPCGLWPHL